VTIAAGYTRVTLLGCPLDLLERSRQHDESLLRELAFVAESDSDTSTAPARLLSLADRLHGRLPELTAQIEEQVSAARARGDDVVNLDVTVPAGGREVAEEMSAAFAEAEQFARSGDLLTPAESDEPGRFRTWYLEQYAHQLDGGSPVAWPQWRCRAR
jgi:hypothetical protein